MNTEFNTLVDDGSLPQVLIPFLVIIPYFKNMEYGS
jgi:hypothetical protein